MSAKLRLPNIGILEKEISMTVLNERLVKALQTGRKEVNLVDLENHQVILKIKITN